MQHLERERQRLTDRVTELETQCSGLMEEKAQLTQEVATVSASAQQLSFQNQTLQVGYGYCYRLLDVCVCICLTGSFRK